MKAADVIAASEGMTPREQSESGTGVNKGGQRDLSVVIVNRNTLELLRACLHSILELPDSITHEVIVVDNGSSDGSADMVRERYPWVQLVRNETNTGYAFPNNQGIARSRGRYVMLLNSDTEVRPFAFQRLVEFMDGHPDVGACGPMLVYPDGRLQPSCASFPSLWVHFCDMLLLDKIFPRSRWLGNQYTHFDHRHTAPVDQPAGAALLVRRDVIDTVGVLDERFKIYYNDVDWCYRIRQAGWKIYFVHDAVVEHHLGATTRNENQGMQLNPEMIKNYFDYFSKHFGSRGLWWFRVWTVIGYSLRRAIFLGATLFSAADSIHWRARYYGGVLRAAWTGDPNRFASGE